MISAELNIRPGTNPTALPEHQALKEELSKLLHPAQPDVNWDWVEYQCENLIRKHGIDLYSAAALMLARTNLQKLLGLEEGIAFLSAQLSRHSTVLWPRAAQDRQRILNWLFLHLQPLLRGLEVLASDLEQIKQVQRNFYQLAPVMARDGLLPLPEMEALGRQLDSLAKRLERELSGTQPVAFNQSAEHPEPPYQVVELPANTSSVVFVNLEGRATPPSVEPPPLPRRKGQRLVALLAIFGAVAIGVSLACWEWKARHSSPAISTRSPEVVSLNSTLLFAPGSAQLKPEATKVLIRSLLGLQARPNWLILITGHSDSSGSAEQNHQLSQDRAMAVKDWMQQMGNISESCFLVRGLSDTQPIASNDHEQGRSANRRVDIQLLPQTGACTASTNTIIR